MIKFLSYLILINYYCCFDLWQPYSTSVYANNYLYVYDTFRADYKSAGISKYTLKDGPIKDLKVEYFNLNSIADYYYSPIFIDIPNDIRKNLPEGEKAWLFSCNNYTFNTRDDNYYPQAQLEAVDDEARRTNSISSIEKPTLGNMGQSAYGVTGVREGDNFSIYVFGGIANNKKYNNTVVTNGFLKYDSKANKWSDIGSKMPPEARSAFHKAVNVDDKYIYVLGGIYVMDDLFKNSIAENNYPLNYKTFKEFRRYNIAKGQWEYLVTTSPEPSPVNFISGRWGFSATYHKGKIYVYGGVHHETNVIDNGHMVQSDSIYGYLGILDIEKHVWEWHEPKESNGEKSNRKLAYHDSIVWNNQLILTHGDSADDKYKYKIHAIDLDTKQFSDYIGPAPKAKSGDAEKSSGLPSYAIAIIVVVIILAILTAGYLVYRKRRQSKSKSNNSSTSLQPVWATPQNAIVNNSSPTATGTGLTGNTVTNKSPLSSDLEAGGKDPNESRMTQFYMDLPYFQHEVDTHDTRIDNLANDR